MPDLPPQLGAFVASFKLHLRAAGRAKSTWRGYVDSTEKLGRWMTREGHAANWTAVTKAHLQLYMVWLQTEARGCWCGRPRTHGDNECPKGRPMEKGYINNQYRAVQQFFKWLASEEDIPNPMLGMSPPKIGEKVVPLLSTDDLAAVIKQCASGKDFESRRDHALLRLFACTGIRLSELATLKVEDINLDLYEALVTGKNDRQRIVKFDVKCAQALDRYINRARATHKLAASTRLWLAVKNRGPLTPNGVRQVVERRGLQVGLDGVFPHQFRHTFTHRWLDAGGAEGDLMELNGWESPQMLRRYGRSARSARARRAYDRVNVMGEI